MSTDTLTDLLNKVTAIVRCGASTFPELARETGIPYKQVHAMVTQRQHRPDGKRVAALFEWAARKTQQIAMGGRPLQLRYKDEYRKAYEKFPAMGEKL